MHILGSRETRREAPLIAERIAQLKGGRWVELSNKAAKINVSTTQAGGGSPDLTNGTNSVARSRTRNFN